MTGELDGEGRDDCHLEDGHGGYEGPRPVWGAGALQTEGKGNRDESWVWTVVVNVDIDCLSSCHGYSYAAQDLKIFFMKSRLTVVSKM